MGLKETILGAQDNQVISLDVREWNCTVYIRTWTGTERANFQTWYSTAQKDPERMGELLGRIAVLSLCDEQGNRLFTDEDLPALNSKSAKALDQVSMAALKHNAISPEAVEDAKANFQQVQS